MHGREDFTYAPVISVHKEKSLYISSKHPKKKFDTQFECLDGIKSNSENFKLDQIQID